MKGEINALISRSGNTFLSMFMMNGLVYADAEGNNLVECVMPDCHLLESSSEQINRDET